MEKQRRLSKGKLAEIFGEEALGIDEFMLYIGLDRSSRDSWDQGTIEAESAKYLQAYADGVNDYVQGVSIKGLVG